MDNDRLHELFQHADAAAPPPVMAAGLTNRVLHVAHHRAMRRTAIVTFTCIAICGLAVATTIRKRNVPNGRISAAELAAIRAELVRMDADALQHQRNAEAFRKRDASLGKQADLPPMMPEPDVMQRVDEARDRAALVLLRWADRTATDPANQAHADEMYSRVAGLFPNTPAGRIAARRFKPADHPT